MYTGEHIKVVAGYLEGLIIQLFSRLFKYLKPN